MGFTERPPSSREINDSCARTLRLRSRPLIWILRNNRDVSDAPKFANSLKVGINTGAYVRQTQQSFQPRLIAVQLKPEAMDPGNNRDIESKCWKCGHSFSSPITLECNSCNVVQPLADKVNFFQLFQSPQTFNFDVKKASDTFKDLQRKYHPDRFSNRSKEEQIISKMSSSTINNAYNILKDPQQRARYMLVLNGSDFDEEATIEDNNLLLEIMEKREAIESEAEEVGDIMQSPPETSEVVEQIARENTREIEDCLERISKGFESHDIQRVKEQVVKLQYLARIDEAARKRLRENE
ncbi:hypothetical protein PROFUN_04172 [Planoprotostelium fungivorum]|uniref:J domain-containing protein n=1 Tax=Planoprotostelium fungivorum TaxID=1890364 RepID=A0A2P6NVT6_9EUKA|nr:hypothetical protein PROFUN_04172 [Planoprotostelium fungivorum]